MAGKAQEIKSNQCACSSDQYVYRDGMRFARTALGLVFCPEYNPHNRKHPCPDCMNCAFCADARCAACLGESQA